MEVSFVEVRRSLFELLSTIDGLYAIFVSDFDGVVVLNAQSDRVNELGFSLKHPLLSAFHLTSEQTGKVDFGENRSCICYFSNNQVVQLNCSKFLVTIVASENTNTGNLLGLGKVIDPLLNDLACIEL